MNLVQFGNVFEKLFPGIKYEAPWLTYWRRHGRIHRCAWLMIYLNLEAAADALRRQRHRSRPRQGKSTPYYTYIVPVFPVLMIMVFKWQIIPTFLVCIVLALVADAATAVLQGHLNLFNKTFYDAFPDIATIAALWTICGMIIVAGQMPQVADALKPIFSPILPHTPAQAALFFGVLGGVLSIYRGPLVVVGTGAALLAIMLSAEEIPVPYLYALWLAPTVMQGSVDPTNSWTLWTIGYTKVSHGQFLKTALPFGWLMVAICSAICYAWLG